MKQFFVRALLFFVFTVFVFGPAAVIYAHVAINTAPTTACGSLDSTNLSTHIGNQIDNRITLQSAATGLPLFSSRSLSTSSPWTRNTSSWTAKLTPIDFTGVSAWSYHAGTMAYTQTVTLITPRHFITAEHYKLAIGDEVGFIDASGNHITRTIMAMQNIANTDITVGVLDSDVPDTITYYPMMASSTLEGTLQTVVPQTLDIPEVIFDQEGKALIHSLTDLKLDTGTGLHASIAHEIYSSGVRQTYSEILVGGDSSEPHFLVIDSQPVFLSATFASAYDDNDSYFIPDINSIITALGSNGYQVTIYDPTTCFTNNHPNHKPQFVGTMATSSFNETTSFPVAMLSTFTTSDDVDTGQTYTYSVVSISTHSRSTVPSPTDYFDFTTGTANLVQKKHLDQNQYGSDLTMVVQVSDNGTPVQTATTSLPISHSAFRSSVSVDSRFATTTDKGGGGTSLSPIAIFDSSNRLVVTGPFISVGSNSALSFARFTTSGSLDTSYIPSVNLGTTTIPTNILEMSDGSYLISGAYTNFNGSTDSRKLVRFAPDASLNSTFMSGIGTTSAGNINRIALYGDKVLLYGSVSSFNGTSVPKSFMLNDDGTIYTAFSTSLGTGLTGSSLDNRSLIVDGTNILYFGNFTGFNGTTITGIAKINGSTGALDTTFKTNLGTAFNNSTSSQKIMAAALTPSGKYVAVGAFTQFNGTDSSRIALLNSDGTLNTTFSTNIGTGFDNTATNMIVQPDGKIIVGGASITSFNSITTGALSRLNSDGTLDTSFHNNLPAVLGSASLSNVLGNLSLDTNGRLVVTGNKMTGLGRNYEFEIAVLKTDTPDTPTISASASSITSGSSVTLSGQANESGTVYVYDSGTLVGTTTTGTDGLWSLSTTPAVGSHSLKALQAVKILDTATSSLSSAVSVTVSAATVTVDTGGQQTGGGGSGGTGGDTSGIIYYNRATSTVIGVNGCGAGSLFDIFTGVKCAANIPAVTNSAIKYNLFTKSLKINDSNPAVIELQKYLNLLGFKVSPTGAGSPGKESNFFGKKTLDALIKFQKYFGIKPAVGFFGPVTRDYILNHKK